VALRGLRDQIPPKWWLKILAQIEHVCIKLSLYKTTGTASQSVPQTMPRCAARRRPPVLIHLVQSHRLTSSGHAARPVISLSTSRLWNPPNQRSKVQRNHQHMFFVLKMATSDIADHRQLIIDTHDNCQYTTAVAESFSTVSRAIFISASVQRALRWQLITGSLLRKLRINLPGVFGNVRGKRQRQETID